MAQNGSLVYYALTVNNVFALYRTMQGATVPAGTKFPVDPNRPQRHHGLCRRERPADRHRFGGAGHRDQDVVGRGGKPGPDASKFIQMKAIVPTYDTSDPDDWVPNGTKTMMLAMVGMHIVAAPMVIRRCCGPRSST